jgi:DNA-binding LytR/AlgR family response regulator
MKKLRVLIVEDEILVVIDLEAIIAEIFPATIIVKTSVASTKKVLHEPFDFAFLDVDVTNGKTFEVARLLAEKGVPFVFVSGASPNELPDALRDIPFIPKPFMPSQIKRALLGSEPGGKTHLGAGRSIPLSQVSAIL